MAKMKPPILPEVPVPIVPADALQALLATCEGSKKFVDHRHAAILRCDIDTGARSSEVATSRSTTWTPDDELFIVLGKFRRPRLCPFGSKRGKALDRYLRAGRGSPRSPTCPSYGSADWPP